MAESVQLMVLPANVPDAPPQVLIDDGGLWRDTLPPPVVSPQSKLKQSIEQYLASVMDQVGRIPPGQVDPKGVAFKSRFEQLLRALLSTEVLNGLKAANAVGGTAASLNIFFRRGVEWIPWELLHDGTNFLGVKFAMTRLPILDLATGVRGSRTRTVSKVYSLLARDVLDGATLTDWESTFSAFSPAAGWESRFPANGAGNFPTLGQFDEAAEVDVIHVTCHGGFKDAASDEYDWTLDHTNPSPLDYRITPTIASGVGLRARPLVFGNACASAAAFTNDPGSLQGFGSNFLVGGALNFVGTFAPITKSMAVAFARRFYERLFGGLPIAEALRATKQSFADQNSTDPSYLFYCLYGPADTTYKPAV